MSHTTASALSPVCAVETVASNSDPVLVLLSAGAHTTTGHLEIKHWTLGSLIAVWITHANLPAQMRKTARTPSKLRSTLPIVPLATFLLQPYRHSVRRTRLILASATLDIVGAAGSRTQRRRLRFSHSELRLTTSITKMLVSELMRWYTKESLPHLQPISGR